MYFTTVRKTANICISGTAAYAWNAEGSGKWILKDGLTVIKYES